MRDREDGWAGFAYRGWQDLDAVRRRLDEGADPDAWRNGRPLHRAAGRGSPEVVTEMARRVADVDALEAGTTALWEAVLENRPENAKALAAAGADPWRPLIAGWSPGRLSLAGPVPDLFVMPEGERGLSETERTAAEEGRRLVAVLDGIVTEGTGLACVAGIDAEEAIRRLEATPADDDDLEVLLEDYPDEHGLDEILRFVGVTSVPGGCVVTQPWGYAPSMPEVLVPLSADTVCYGLYANPKSGGQGSVVCDGQIEGWDLIPGGSPAADSSPEEVLASYLYRHDAVAFACAYAELRLPDARAVVGPPDHWVELPNHDGSAY
ncbi:ankyrin repeat domain-containing protein [Streptomyces sp. NPDC047108]|uniref:ankyrin repeat domain-containing protein n=1 Tax=Streptomyces sp. NPDC047108 TaxID=3155025 RepID=UPI0033FB5BC8